MKLAAVQRLMRGESLEALSRELSLPAVGRSTSRHGTGRATRQAPRAGPGARLATPRAPAPASSNVRL